MTKSLAAVAMLVLLSSSAHADRAGTPISRPFVMSGLGEKSSVGVELQYASYNRGPEITVVTVELVADVSVGRNVVLLGRVPIAFVDADFGLVSCCDTALGNVTLGVRFRKKLRSSRGSTVGAVETSISLPTADKYYNPVTGDTAGVSAAEASYVQMPHDAGRYLPNFTVLRGSAFLYGAVGTVFFEGELGLHVWLNEGDPMTGETQTNLKLGLAGGVFLSDNVALLAELSNWANLSDLDGEGNESLWHSIDVGFRIHAKQGSLGARLYVPLDETFRDRDLIGFGLDGRAEF